MKKIYLILLLALTSICASAQDLYLRGGDYGWNEGDCKESNKFTKNGDIFTLSGFTLDANKGFKIATNTWNEHNYGGNGSDLMLAPNTEAELLNDGGSKDIKLTQAVTNATVIFNISTRKIIVRENPEIKAPAEGVYLVGEMNNWNAVDNEGWKLEKKEGEETYVLRNLSFGTGDFKIVENGTVFGSEDGTVVVRNVKHLHEDGGSLHLSAADTQLTFTYNAESNLLIVSKPGTVLPGVELPADNVYVAYFENTANWETVKVYVWCDASNPETYVLGTWPGKELTEDDKVTIDGKEYYKVVAEVPTDTHEGHHNLQIIFHNGKGTQTSDLHFVHNGIYNANGFTEKLVAEDPVEPTYATIYFNANQYYFEESKMNQKPIYVYAYPKNGGSAVQLAGTMTKLVDRDAMFSFTVKNPEKYKGVIFKSNDQEYDGLLAEGFEENNWTKYIYSADEEDQAVDGYKPRRAYQSYMTFEELQEWRNSEKEDIYFIGTGIGAEGEGNEPWSNFGGMLDVKNAGEGYGWAQEGVYVRRFDDLQKGEFKMSSIDPADLRENAAEFPKRWWATFNLAIVGPVEAGQKVSGEVNGQFFYKVNEVEPYNNCNQYNWVFEKPEGSTATSHYLVIDVNTKHTAIVPFRPMPLIENAKAGAISKKAFSTTATGTLSKETSGKFLKGSATSGEARFEEYNQTTGTVEVIVSEGIRENLYEKGYTVYYGIYNDGQLVAGFNGIKEADKYVLALSNMVAGESAELEIRCTYTEPESTGGLSFYSITSKKQVVDNDDQNYDFAKMSVIDGSKNTSLFLDGRGWNMLVSLETKLDGDNEYAVYPDFKTTNSNNRTVRVLDSEEYATLTQYFFEAKESFAHKPVHTKYVSGEYKDATHNWAALMEKEDGVYEYHLLIEGIAPGTTSAADVLNKTVDLTLYASYPFLTDDNAAPSVKAYKKEGTEFVEINQPVSVRRRADGIDTHDDINYKLTTMSEPTPLTLAATDAGMSGVSDVAVDAADAEFFTLQGVRIEGELTPGIYIRRAAGKAEKVVIR